MIDLDLVYSRYAYLRDLAHPALGASERARLERAIGTGELRITAAQPPRLLWAPLEWDSRFFSAAVMRIERVDHGEASLREVVQGIRAFQRTHATQPRSLVIAEVPVEDSLALQALTAAGFRVVEVRATYWRRDLPGGLTERFPVRLATPEDADEVARVAEVAVNRYDRFHADVFFTAAEADRMLAEFGRQSVLGFAEYVLLPSPDAAPAGGFMTANTQRDIWPRLGRNVGRMVLSAVTPERRGWYRRLVSEMTHLLHAEGCQSICLTTQATNGAVISVWESLGYRFGASTVVVSYSPTVAGSSVTSTI